MAAILLSLILFLQGIPIQQGGTVTGVLRDSAGSPLPGVRMAAVARPDSLETLVEGTAMAGIAQTDGDGRYTLENIPPGRYVIAAGRLDLQTYYPGTQEMADARVVAITPGAVLNDIDFVLSHTSLGRSPESPDFFGLIRSNATTIPLRITVENRGKLPISSNGRFVTVRLESSAGEDVSFPIESSNVGIAVPVPVTVRATVENLPDFYSVQTVMYGTTDVTRGTFRLSPPPFPSIPSLLSITLSAKPATRGSGARVTGSVGEIGKRNIYMSGKPGVVYADGTFEFRDVVPGLHVIATVNNPSLPRAAIVSVGDTDVSGIQLKETVLLPPDIRDPKDPLPAGNHAPGTTIPLARVSGVVLEESTKEPLRGELVLKAGDFLRTFPIDENGRFEAFSLVPGTYDIRFEIFGHATLGPSLVIEDADVKLELTSRRLY